MTTEIERSLSADADEALSRFVAFTRSNAFSLSFGVREIRLLADRPWHAAWSMRGSELDALHRLLGKGMLTHVYGQSPSLSEAGKLVRQLMILSRHVLPDAAAKAAVPDLFELLCHALDWYYNDNFRQTREVRVIDGEPHLVLRLREPDGHASEWAVARSAVKRIG
jgi:hypothetical protein